VAGQLGSRAGLIEQAAEKTGHLQELLRGLAQTCGRLEAQLSGEPGRQHSSTQPDAVKKQLEEVHAISAQLREERQRLKEAEAVAAELAAMVTEEYLKADLARQLEAVSKPFKQLEEKTGSARSSVCLLFFSWRLECLEVVLVWERTCHSVYYWPRYNWMFNVCTARFFPYNSLSAEIFTFPLCFSTSSLPALCVLPGSLDFDLNSDSIDLILCRMPLSNLIKNE